MPEAEIGTLVRWCLFTGGLLQGTLTVVLRLTDWHPLWDIFAAAVTGVAAVIASEVIARWFADDWHRGAVVRHRR